MTRTLALRNRQRTRRVDTTRLRRLARHWLDEELRVTQYEICVHLVAAPEMARLNEGFLGHEGSTDVLTFDEFDGENPTELRGEIFVCLDDAVAQARRFRTSWQAELARYVLHGLLHLSGFDDVRPDQRRVMKCEEKRLLRAAARRFPLDALAKASE